MEGKVKLREGMKAYSPIISPGSHLSKCTFPPSLPPSVRHSLSPPLTNIWG